MILNRKIFSNSLWMMLEKVIGIFGLIFVTSFVAKYIGPSNFGKIAFVATIFTFVQTFTWFGNQEILFKRVSRSTKSGLNYLSNTQDLRKKIFVAISLPILSVFYYFTDHLTFIFGLATALSTYFLTQDIYAIYNNATLKSFINAIVNMVGLIIALVLRYIIVLFELDYSYLAIPIVVVTAIPYLLKKYIFNKQDKSVLKQAKGYRRYYFMAGGSLVLSTLSVSFYTQITSFLLATLHSTYELGIYAAAVPLGMSWSFINLAIITSVLTSIYKEKDAFKSYSQVARLNLVIIVISLIVIMGQVIFGQWAIEILYGKSYEEAFELLIILGFATLFSGLGTISARLMVKEESYSYISKKMMIIAFISLPIAWVMVHFAGMKGAAYSVLIIEILSATVLNYFYKKGLIFKIHLFPFYKKVLKLHH